MKNTKEIYRQLVSITDYEGKEQKFDEDHSWSTNRRNFQLRRWFELFCDWLCRDDDGDDDDPDDEIKFEAPPKTELNKFASKTDELSNWGLAKAAAANWIAAGSHESDWDNADDKGNCDDKFLND